jgi:hypothetical protein
VRQQNLWGKTDVDRIIESQKTAKSYTNHVRSKYGANTTETLNEKGMILGPENINLPMDEFSKMVAIRFNRLNLTSFQNLLGFR